MTLNDVRLLPNNRAIKAPPLSIARSTDSPSALLATCNWRVLGGITLAWE